MTELAIVLPCLNEADNLCLLVPKINEVVSSMSISYRIFVIDGGSTDNTVSVAQSLGATVIPQRGAGYGGAIRTAFEDIETRWLLTMDADFSHHPVFIKYLFARRYEGEIIIASRFTPQGYGEMAWSRKILSGSLNRVFGFVLDLPVRDLSSGFRLYHRNAIRKLDLHYETYAVLQEVLIKSWCRGYRVVEEPFHYLPRRHGSSHARVFKFGKVYLQSLYTLWKYRNRLQSADYDARAFYSRILPQRWWQRRRCQILRDFIGDRMSVLDVGCGSTQLLNNVPQAIGVDTNPAKLRFMRRPARILINASVSALPFPDESFDVILASHLIEHLPQSEIPFRELARCLKSDGTLVIATPDYGRRRWRFIKKIYNAIQPTPAGDIHPNPFTFSSLRDSLEQHQFSMQEYEYICGAELIVSAAKIKSSDSHTP